MIAIGVPTVVNAAVIAHKTIEELFSRIESEPGLANFYNPQNEKLLMNVIQKALSPFQNNLMVTPKEIDELIEQTAKIIANAINMTVHPGISASNFETYLH